MVESKDEFCDYDVCDGYVMVQADDSTYKSSVGVVSNLKKGGSLIGGIVVKVGAGVPHSIYNVRCFILKYECLEISENLFLVSYKDDKLRMFKKHKDE